MRKFIFALFVIPFILTGCTSESTTVIPPKTIKTVRFNVALAPSVSNVSSTLVTESKMTFDEVPVGTYIQYVIYKEDGSIQLAGYIPLADDISGSITFEEELPVGTLHAVLIKAEKTSDGTPVLTPANYDTDYCIGNNSATRINNNLNIFFDSFTYNVKGCGACNDEVDIVSAELQPMWSEVNMEIVANDPYIISSEVTDIVLEVEPYHYGFAVTDGIASREIASSASDLSLAPAESRMSIEEFYAGSRMLTCPIAASAGTVIRLSFYQNIENDMRLLRRDYLYKGATETNQVYMFKHPLGDGPIDNPDNPNTGERP